MNSSRLLNFLLQNKNYIQFKNVNKYILLESYYINFKRIIYIKIQYRIKKNYDFTNLLNMIRGYLTYLIF